MCDHLDSADGLRITREPRGRYGLFWVVRYRDSTDPEDILEIHHNWHDAMSWAQRYIELES